MIVVLVIVGLIVVSLLIRAFDKGSEETVRFDRSMWTETRGDEYHSDAPRASHTYRITSSPQEEQNWLSSLAQPYDLDSIAVQIVSNGSSLQVTVTVRGEDAELFIEQLPGKISAPSPAQRSPTDEW